MTFPSSDGPNRDAPYFRNPPRNEGRGQRNDRPPRFQRDTDFPKPGGEAFPPPPSSGPSQSQRGRASERGGRAGQDRRQDDRREGRSNGTSNSLPSSFSAPSFSSFPSSSNRRPREHHQGPSGSFQQEVRDHHQGSRDNMHSGGHPQGSRDHGSGPRNQQQGPDSQNQKKGLLNGPAPKPFESADPRGRGEPNNRRKGNRFERPSSVHYDRNLEGGGNLNSGPSLEEDRGGARPPGGGRVSGDMHLQNGDSDPRRTGPIKQQR